MSDQAHDALQGVLGVMAQLPQVDVVVRPDPRCVWGVIDEEIDDI